MIQIAYKRGLKVDATDTITIAVHKFNHQYFASVLDKATLTYDRSKDYNNLKGLNNFLKKYDVEVIK